MHSKSIKHKIANWLWDGWCILTLVGIWPRYIEPKLLQSSRLTLPVKDLPPELDNLRLVQFSDLHINRFLSDKFLNKLTNRINGFDPDLILFTGDFICYSHLNDPIRLLNFLCTLKAKHGCFAILGNHDYSKCVSINQNGDYDIIGKETQSHPLKKAFERLAFKTVLSRQVTERAQSVELHQELVDLIAKTPFKLLHNESVLVPINNSAINICGLGEYMLGRFQPNIAFKNYKKEYPGIILSHNPDTAPKLVDFPGEIILSGHTHGGQVNLPFIWKRFTLLENMNFKKGLLKLKDKMIYINKGVGSVFHFRWFAMPEVLLLTLYPGQHQNCNLDCSKAPGLNEEER